MFRRLNDWWEDPRKLVLDEGTVPSHLQLHPGKYVVIGVVNSCPGYRISNPNVPCSECLVAIIPFEESLNAATNTVSIHHGTLNLVRKAVIMRLPGADRINWSRGFQNGFAFWLKSTQAGAVCSWGECHLHSAKEGHAIQSNPVCGGCAHQLQLWYDTYGTFSLQSCSLTPRARRIQYQMV